MKKQRVFRKGKYRESKKRLERKADIRNGLVLYLEGNSQGAIVGKYEKNNWEYAQLEQPYGDSALTISCFFQLTGYCAKAQEEFYFDENKWYTSDEKGNHIELRIKAYKSLLEEYKRNPALRKCLILNKKEKEKANNVLSERL